MCDSFRIDNVASRFTSTPALQCCFGGFFALCHWCLRVGVLNAKDFLKGSA